jgi:hypothetical protein
VVLLDLKEIADLLVLPVLLDLGELPVLPIGFHILMLHLQLHT